MGPAIRRPHPSIGHHPWRAGALFTAMITMTDLIEYDTVVPQFLSQYDPRIGRVTVSAKSRFRHIVGFWPYFVGDQVRFVMELERPARPENQLWNIVQHVGDSKTALGMFEGTTMDVTGEYIDAEGNLKISIGPIDPALPRLPVVTARVWNTDSFLFPVLLAVLTTILGFVFGLTR